MTINIYSQFSQKKGMKISGYSLKKPKMTMINSFHDSKLTNP